VTDNGSGLAYWTANSADAELQVTSETFGNGATQTQSFDPATGRLTGVTAGSNNGIANWQYSWDGVGNLLSRTDTIEGYTEYFCYDQLNRLTTYAIGSSCTASGATSIGYDALGDITSKSDVGTYAYPAAGQAHPHAVSSITGTVNGVTNPSFAYDANGNMTSGAGRTMSWTAFNMASQITQGAITVNFTYDAFHHRIVQAVSGSSSSTTTYLNALGAQSQKVVSGATTTWEDYIYAGGALVAERFSGGTSAVRYITADQLGSVSAVANETAGVTERLSYDAWGKRRNANGSPDTTCSITSAIGKGFTGQEMMDSLCLINMNARIYDPTIGRFLSADPTVPAPFDGQSYNRYTYVLNNPLSLTDPTGLAQTERLHVQAIDPCGSPSGCATGTLFSASEFTDHHNFTGSEIQSGFFAGLTLAGAGNPGGGFGGGYWSYKTTGSDTFINGVETYTLTATPVFVSSYAGQQFGNPGFVTESGTNWGGLGTGALLGTGGAAVVVTGVCVALEPCGLAEGGLALAGVGVGSLTSYLAGKYNPASPITSSKAMAATTFFGGLGGGIIAPFAISSASTAVIAGSASSFGGGVLGQMSGDYLQSGTVNFSAAAIAGGANVGGYYLGGSAALDAAFAGTSVNLGALGAAQTTASFGGAFISYGIQSVSTPRGH
jgi:RHS repeat-associated protein